MQRTRSPEIRGITPYGAPREACERSWEEVTTQRLQRRHFISRPLSTKRPRRLPQGQRRSPWPSRVLAAASGQPSGPSAPTDGRLAAGDRLGRGGSSREGARMLGSLILIVILKSRWAIHARHFLDGQDAYRRSVRVRFRGRDVHRLERQGAGMPRSGSWGVPRTASRAPPEPGRGRQGARMLRSGYGRDVVHRFEGASGATSRSSGRADAVIRWRTAQATGATRRVRISGGLRLCGSPSRAGFSRSGSSRRRSPAGSPRFHAQRLLLTPSASASAPSPLLRGARAGPPRAGRASRSTRAR